VTRVLLVDRVEVDRDVPSHAPLAFHRSMDGYAPTPLREAPAVAAAAGLRRVLVKDESSRLGLPSFKILGASWATNVALSERVGRLADTFAELRELVEPLRPLRLVAATDGNHGRAVAHMARLLGLSSKIYVPRGTAQARIDAIAGEGAAVEVVDGSYDAAVERSAADAADDTLVVSDTSWPGYETVPRAVIDGYSTIFAEVDDAGVAPQAVVVQIGVGALAAAVVRRYREPFVVGVEPESAACVLASVAAGQMLRLPGEPGSIMAGLNCGEPSLVAWPLVSRGIDLYVAIDDESAREAMRLLARDGIVAGETGAAGAAALLALRDPAAAGRLKEAETVLVVCTEGATDPAAYAAVVRPGQAWPKETG